MISLFSVAPGDREVCPGVSTAVEGPRSWPGSKPH